MTDQIAELVEKRLQGHSVIPQFVVLTAKAKMPRSCWGRYGRVAVIETNRIDMPKQINTRHNSVVSIRFHCSPLYIGTSEKCAFNKAVAQAEKIAEKLNKESESSK